jgi:hypothetical protein
MAGAHSVKGAGQTSQGTEEVEERSHSWMRAFIKFGKNRTAKSGCVT